MISWNNNYYQILDKDNSIKQIYKGTEIQVFENVLTKVVRIKYYNIFYETKQIEGHRQDHIKREQMRIDNQKQLEQVLKERHERLKARANKVSS
jgi:RNA binding exosome subunit